MLHSRTLLFALTCLTLFEFGVVGVFAQEEIDASKGNSEYTGAILFVLSGELEKSNMPAILIARLGLGEQAKALNRERLSRACMGLTWDSDSPKCVKAEGRKVQGRGRVEIYIDGKLRLSMLAKRNRLFCLSCCDGCIDRLSGLRRSQKSKRTISNS